MGRPAVEPGENGDAEKIGAGIIIPGRSLTVRSAGEDVGVLRTKDTIAR